MSKYTVLSLLKELKTLHVREKNIIEQLLDLSKKYGLVIDLNDFEVVDWGLLKE